MPLSRSPSRLASDSGYSTDGYAVVSRPRCVSTAERRAVRAAMRRGQLDLERRSGMVRPCQRLRNNTPCVVSCLGECGDRKCGNYRLGRRTSDVRPSFLDFCVHHIRERLPIDILEKGLVYSSLGSGSLLFDWELLERLTLEEGIRLRTVLLIDKEYGPKGRASARTAVRTFAGWFGDIADELSAGDSRSESGSDGPTIRTFPSAVDFEEFVRRSGERAHVLMDCDAVGARKKLDVAAFRASVLQSGGVCLVLSNPAKRTALVKVPLPPPRLPTNEASQALDRSEVDTLELQYYDTRRFVWTSHKPPESSSSSSRSRRPRRRRSRRYRPSRAECPACGCRHRSRSRNRSRVTASEGVRLRPRIGR